MTIDRRVRVTAAILILSVLVMVFILFWSSRQVDEGIQRTESASRIIGSVYMMSSLMNDYVDHSSGRALTQWEQHREMVGRILNEVDFNRVAPELVSKLRMRLEAVDSLTPQVVRMVSSKAGDPQDERSRGLLTDMMGFRLEQLVNTANDLNRAAQVATLNQTHFVQRIIVLGGIGLTLIILINIYLIRKSVIHPLQELSAGAERIGEGKFDYVAETKQADEIGMLAQAFNIMAERRRAAEQALRESEERLRLAQSSANVGVWEWHLGSGKVIWTEEQEKLYGYAEGTFPGTYEGFSERVHPDDLAEVERLYKEAVKASKPFDFDFRIRLPSGETRWLSCKGAAHYDETGNPHRIFGVNADITERKQAQDQLTRAYAELEQRVLDRTVELRQANEKLMIEVDYRKRAEESVTIERQRLFEILETMPVMVCLLTPDYHIAFANRSFRERFGEDDGRHCFDYCFGRKEPCEFCETYHVLENGEPHYWEVAGPDGSIIAAYDFPFRDTDGSPLILEMATDITEQRRAQEIVATERRRLYDVLETLPVYVCLLDSDYRMPFANRYFRETFGESHGRRCHDVFFNRTEPCEICDTYTVMKTGAPHHWYWTGPNERDYDIYDFPFIDADGSRLILEMGIDITERKHAEEALKETLADLTRSNEDLQQFAYVASHDLQEPLRNVATCLQMLEKKYRNSLDTDTDKLIRFSVEGATRMRALIQDLLAYSRVATKGKAPERIDCEQVLERALKNLRSSIAEAESVITHDPLPTIRVDDTQLLQVFQNLIQNAIKFRRHEPPKVHVCAVKNKNEWIFSVTDNGIGIKTDQFERIFVIFQRLHKRDHYDGTGLGLAIVKKVVERHGGRVWVESELGVGSTFYFTIPEKAMQI